MRFVFLLAFGGFILEAIARPQPSVENESEVDRSEYEGAGELADDYLSDKSAEELNIRSLNRDNSIKSRKAVPDKTSHSNIISYLHSPQNNNQFDNPGSHETGYRKSNIFDSQVNQDDQTPLSERRQLNPNLNHDEIEEEEEETPLAQMESHANHNKRNNENNGPNSEESVLSSNDEDSSFYEDDRRLMNDKSEYNNEPGDATKQQLIEKHNSFDSRREMVLRRQPDTIFLNNRDRRQVSLEQNDKSVNDDTKLTDKKSEVEYTGEDNESAIKRNIKKLSREELEDLFNSLSDDKKALLKKIIDTKLESVNKREITKKAGAVEENNCIEGGSSDLSKIDGGRSLDPSPSVSSSDTTETTKQTEINEVSSPKNSESESGSAKSDIKNELNDDNLHNLKQETEKVGDSMENNVEPKIDINIQEIAKNENKRDTNTFDKVDDKPDIGNEELSGETQYALGNEMDCSKDDSWSELMKDESELHNTFSNLYKRDADTYAKSVNIKSLEESFPNYEFVDPKASDSKLTPLIRVKRTNTNVAKRGTDHCANMKVPFFPSALDDGIDDTENTEFDEGGIFERASNYEKVGKRNHCMKTDQENINHYSQRSKSKQNHLKSQSDFSKVGLESNSANIGSDTDNVLSNVEGVDENLMFNKGLRKKRISDESKLNDEIVNIDNNDLISKLPTAFASGDKDELVQNSFNYRDSDAFGPIPQSSEAELSRIKRIRRLKPSPTMRSNI